MPRFRGGTIQRAALQRTLRVVAAVVAVALAVGAVWLIVTAKTTKHAQVGALLGFWSLLMAAFSGLGGRHARVADRLGPATPGTDVDLRPVGWLDRIEDAERRVAYERELLELVRHEITSSLAPELANLRADVAALRGEILETVGGQIRLERIETTRMIGSDLEALQRELRQLRTGPASEARDVEVREAIASAVPPAAPTMPATAPVPAPVPVPATATPPVWEQAMPAKAQPEPYEDDDENDPFALLPRITPYPGPEAESAGSAGSAGGHGAVYAGRRRAVDDEAPPSGRHSAGEVHRAGAVSRRSGGRRRRDDDAGHDVLARILERESHA